MTKDYSNVPCVVDITNTTDNIIAINIREKGVEIQQVIAPQKTLTVTVQDSTTLAYITKQINDLGLSSTVSEAEKDTEPGIEEDPDDKGDDDNPDDTTTYEAGEFKVGDVMVENYDFTKVEGLTAETEIEGQGLKDKTKTETYTFSEMIANLGEEEGITVKVNSITVKEELIIPEGVDLEVTDNLIVEESAKVIVRGKLTYNGDANVEIDGGTVEVKVNDKETLEKYLSSKYEGEINEITLDETLNVEGLAVPEGRNLTIDLNGNRIYVTSNSYYALCNYGNVKIVNGEIAYNETGESTSKGYLLYNAGDMTLENTTMNGYYCVTNGDSDTSVETNANLTVIGGEFNAGYCAFVCYSNSSTVIEGATIESKGFCISANGLHKDAKVSLTDCTLETDGATAIYTPAAGEYEVDKCNIKGLSAIECPAGNVTVKDSKLEATGEFVEDASSTSGSIDDGSTILVRSVSAYAKDTAYTLDVTGTEFISAHGPQLRVYESSKGYGINPITITYDNTELDRRIDLQEDSKVELTINNEVINA